MHLLLHILNDVSLIRVMAKCVHALFILFLLRVTSNDRPREFNYSFKDHLSSTSRRYTEMS